MFKFDKTFTLTFGDRAENHKSMQVIGESADKGMSLENLKEIQKIFTKLGAKCILYNLGKILKEDEIVEPIEDAYLLVVNNGVDFLLGKDEKDKLFNEQDKLKKDEKALMYRKVVHKKARHNLCFSDFNQKADYKNGKGTIVNFNSVPLTKKLLDKLSELDNQLFDDLQCEGNYYYDTNKTYIGFHGDSERKIVIGVRLGNDFPLYYQWYYQNNKIGDLFKIILGHGDIYFMSEKAVGNDWKKKSIYTLRHAAGFEKSLKL